MFKWLVSTILIATSVLAQDSVMIRDFSGGLNTVSSDFDIAPKYARMVHNFDLGRNVGALTRRLGYDPVSAISSSSSDSIRSPYGVYLSDGRQFLTYFSALTGKKYGEIQRSDINGKDISLSYTIAQYWGARYPTTYAMQDGILFMANGQNRMVAYDAIGGKFNVQYPNPFDGGATATTYARPIPPYAPGEPEIYPLRDTTGATIIHGDYIWGLTIQDSGAVLNRRVGYLTPRMRIDSGRAMIRGVQNFFVADSTTTTCPVRYIKLYRTKANPGPITQFTTLYKTGDSVKFPGGAVFMIDDTPDGSLLVADSVMPSELKTSRWSAPARPGQPRIVSLIAEAGNRDTGLCRGTTNLKIMKWAWAITFTDTSFNAESDTGAHIELDSTLILSPTQDSTRWQRVTLGIPKPNSLYQHMGINVYRAPMYFSVLDTSIKDTMFNEIEVGPNGSPKDTAPLMGWNWRSVTARDTSIFGPFRKIGHLGPTDSVFVDTFSIQQWSKGDILRQNRPPSGIKNLVSYDGRIFGSSGSRLYVTLLDSGSFAQMRFIAINQDDGDEITAIFPTRRAIRVLKGGSSYNVYQNDNGDWTRTEVSSGIGCIAPQSIAHSAAGWYYLSSKGVILENDGPYIERTQATQLISAPLKNFDLLPMASKRLAVGVCADNKYMLCIGDTTYVLDEKSQGWGTWSLKFNGATLYGVDANINFVRPDTLYFVQPNSRTLFRYGSSERDNGSDFTATWQSAPLVLDNWDKSASAVGAWVASINSGYDKSTIRIINEQADTLFTRIDTSFAGASNLPTPRFSRMSLGSNLAKAFRIDLAIQRLTPGVTTNPIIIDGIDLYYQRQGKVGE